MPERGRRAARARGRAQHPDPARRRRPRRPDLGVLPGRGHRLRRRLRRRLASHHILAGKDPDGTTTDGDPALPARLFSYVAEPDKPFAVVTP
ncbi:hypothetical protein BM536_032730 [Streptomyces phaeoluteigriseus]|uniref:Uncharacterized protein n=1 Tax=Streptomyces phaeoluteigriseus TaxID=114686 RepID=A0A1V6MK59_9ACTN|nr:hypothetical protein BM536_032730 [Streptomyces phaeoluteigriseus]